MVNCPNELHVVDSKSFCAAMDLWTNCREVGRCLAKEWGKLEEVEQLSLDFDYE